MLRVWPPLAPWQIGLVVVLAASLVYEAIEVVQHGARAIRGQGSFFMWFAYALIFALPRSIRFYENGISTTQTANSTRVRFVPWKQLERYSLEGSHLILTGTSSMLRGGPVEGGAFRLREGDGERVEQVLKRYLPARK